MESKYLIDTNIFIYLMKGDLPVKSHQLLKNIFESKINISVINKIELFSLKAIREQEMNNISSMLNDSFIHGLSEAIIERTIDIRRQHAIKLPDAIIAATCACNNFILLTRNEKDFKSISGLKVHNPYS